MNLGTFSDSYTRMYELEANNRKTEIAFLRSQINPHFLYNTLTMICGMAAEGMTDKIILVTGALSQISSMKRPSRGKRLSATTTR